MYTDKTLTCRECNAAFVFTSGEQEFYASKGFVNEPARCPTCRANRNRTGYGEAGGERRERQMHAVICANCGKEALVPFLPRGDRPVYCSECFDQQRASSAPAVSRGNSW